MKYLLRKELILFFSSAMGYVIIALWLLANSLMLWVFDGGYNIPAGGYATLRPFFSLSPVLLLFFVPAVTMKLFAEEKRSGTMELLLFRPVHLSTVVLAKYLSVCILMAMALLPTLVYVYSAGAISTAGLDIGEIVGGYVAQLCLIAVLASIGVFASSLTSGQLVAFLVAAVFSFIGFYGFDLLASLYSDGSMHNLLADMGMKVHYDSLARGVIDSGSIVYFASLAVFFLMLAVVVNSRIRSKRLYLKGLLVVAVLVAVQLVSAKLNVRADLTGDRRYTLSPQSRELVRQADKPLEVLLYLNGKLNPAFDRLRTSTVEVLDELAQHAKGGIVLKEKNPSAAPDEHARQKNYLKMDERGMRGVAVNERDREGKLSSKVVFPWMEIVYGGDTVPVSLLKKNTELTPQQILNVSIGDLEYGITDAIRLLAMKEPASIAFIEGHGELTEPYVYEAMELLSKYYRIDRGQISGSPEELFPYKVLIIASPRVAFTEKEKYALDQYLMNGGSLFFLLDGVCISEKDFDATGESATLKNEVNLDDMLFNYGVRINPVTVQDMNCTPIRVASAQAGAEDTYNVLPWYFAPLLVPAKDHAITRNVSPLKSEFVNTITWVGEDDVRKTVLLTSSSHAHLLPVPEQVSLRYVEMPADPAYFNESSLPVAGLMEGRFRSLFRNRIRPSEEMPYWGISQKPGKIVVTAGSSLIKNDWKGRGKETEPLPLGYEPITGEQFGNADFIVNTVNYLAGNEQWLHLRSRNYWLRLLNREEVTTGLLKWQIINILAPLGVLLLIGLSFAAYRKRGLRR